MSDQYKVLRLLAKSSTTKIDHRYLVMFTDRDGMILAIEVLGAAGTTELVLRKREGCTDEELFDLASKSIDGQPVEAAADE